MISMYRIGEFAERIGRSASTVRRWEREGRLTARRTTSGQPCRLYGLGKYKKTLKGELGGGR
ncbi:MerR family DNA-binding transcriptional regulator [Streptomyces sp. TS71-3]|uniref:MerR family DNA-binding transcriptional regulator n=1 Tax=Streptomyces sp. TS71-3 TaxID=2733862 RepID=UPI0024B5A66F|nr:MerR family DNA-binding transcriptional regulator [Streptomyces sp. TS71-3]